MLPVTHLLAIVFAASHLVELDLGVAGVPNDLADDLDSLDERFADADVRAVRVRKHLIDADDRSRFELEERDVHDLVRLNPKLFARKANDRVHRDTSCSVSETNSIDNKEEGPSQGQKAARKG
jgi:hypothetical protein